MKNKYYKNNTSLSKKTVALVALALVLLAAAGVFAYNRYFKNSNKPAPQTTQGSDSGINYGPATQQEKQDAENLKKNLDNQGQSDSSSQTRGIKTVTPVITSNGESDGKYMVGARVPGIFENSGTCTLTMTKGSAKATGSRTAVPNVNEMSCGFISIPLSKLSSGTWSATVSYKSSKASGTSEALNVEVK